MKRILLLIIIFELLLCGCEKDKTVYFNDTNTVTLYNLTLQIPKEFVFNAESDTDFIKFYNYNDEDGYNSCMLYIATSEYTSDDLKQTVQDGLLGETDYTYNEKNINGYNWSTGYIKKSNKRSHTFYAINNANREYTISYDDFGSGDDCAKALNIIENSLKFN